MSCARPRSRPSPRSIDTALAEEVAFVVIAGDVYDGSVRGVRAQLAFRDGLQRLSDAGIKTFVAYGNHDPVQEGWSAIDSFPEGVTIFPADSVATIPVEIDGLQVATVSGISYAKAATTDNLALRFEPAKGRGFHVAVLHTNVGGHADHAGYSPCTLDDLRASGHHYWALGHIHRRQALSGGAPHVVYPGNLQGRSTKPSEQGPKGALIVEVSGTSVSETRFVPLDRVRFETVEAEIDDRSLEGLEQALVDAAAEQLHLADGSSVVLRGVIRGAAPSTTTWPGTTVASTCSSASATCRRSRSPSCGGTGSSGTPGHRSTWPTATAATTSWPTCCAPRPW